MNVRCTFFCHRSANNTTTTDFSAFLGYIWTAVPSHPHTQSTPLEGSQAGCPRLAERAPQHVLHPEVVQRQWAPAVVPPTACNEGVDGRAGGRGLGRNQVRGLGCSLQLGRGGRRTTSPPSTQPPTTSHPPGCARRSLCWFPPGGHLAFTWWPFPLWMRLSTSFAGRGDVTHHKPLVGITPLPTRPSEQPPDNPVEPHIIP